MQTGVLRARRRLLTARLLEARVRNYVARPVTAERLGSRLDCGPTRGVSTAFLDFLTIIGNFSGSGDEG